MRRILYIDYLDNISRAIGILFKPFFSEVVFHNAEVRFQSEQARRSLEKRGIGWLSYHQAPSAVWSRAFQELNIKLGMAVVQNRFLSLPVYMRFVKHFGFDENGLDKLNASLAKRVTNRWIYEGTSSFSLIEYIYNDCDIRIYYMPRFVGNYLLAIEQGGRIKPIILHVLFLYLRIKLPRIILHISQNIIGVFNNLFRTSSRNKKKHALEGANFSNMDYGIAFVPHKGLKYDEFYRKTYLYDDDPDSILYKRKLLTLSFEEPDPVSKRFYGIYGIPYDNICLGGDEEQLKKELGGLRRTINIRAELLKPFSTSNILAALFLTQYFRDVMFYHVQLKKYSSLKVIFFHYDILAPSRFLIACHMRNIRTISSQVRPTNHIWSMALIFDDYFIAGDGFEERMRQRNYKIANYRTIGLPKSSYMQSHGDVRRYRKYIDIKASRGLVVCYETPPTEFFECGLVSHLITSENFLAEFYSVLIRLAREFQELYFVVKPKTLRIFELDFYKKMENKINGMKNLEVISDLKKYNPYKMAALADLIIGKHNSLLEEALCVGKKVIFYDNDKYLQSTNNVLNEINVIEDTYEGLRKRIIDITQNGNYLDSHEWASFNKKYFSNRNDKDGFQFIRETVSEIYNVVQ
tara:strand:- start:1470 stop:3371 length:1902 start_codon:yes stop_codon:yes gene_type:complete